MQALEWTDVDLQKNLWCVQRSEWKGHVGTTKGGQFRYFNMTKRLASALQNHRHLISARVVCRADGRPVTQKIVQDHVRRAARLAKVANEGVHVLRHTFCSHLAMRARERRGDTGAREPSGSVVDAAVSTPVASRPRVGDPTARSDPWRQSGHHGLESENVKENA